MLYQLLTLSQEEESILKTLLTNSQGEILIFVHPFQLELTASKRVVEKLPFKMISRFIELFKNENLPPIVILENIRLYQWTAKIAQALFEKWDRAVYLVPTPPTFPIPGYTKPPVSKKAGERYESLYEEAYWQRFLEYLGSVGVKKTLVGGTSLELYQLTQENLLDPRLRHYQAYYEQRRNKGASNTNYVPARCVGTVAAWLSTVFDVEITNLTLPHNRADILYIENLQPAPIT